MMLEIKEVGTKIDLPAEVSADRFIFITFLENARM